MRHDRSIPRQYEWRRRVIIETLRAREEPAVARRELPAFCRWFHGQRAAVDAALDGCCICELLGGGRRLVVGFVHGWTYLGLPDGAACARSAIELCFLFFLEGSVVPAACSSGWHGYVGPILKYVGSRIGLTYPSYIPLAGRHSGATLLALPRRACERHRREAAIKKRSSDALDAR